MFLSKCLLSFICCCLFFILPAWADSPTVAITTLTLEALPAHLEPIQDHGLLLLDFRDLEINLTAENTEFQKQFYQQVQRVLNRSKQPLGLDLSRSVIEGNLDFNRLTFQTPAVSEALSPLLSPEEQKLLEDNAPLQSLADFNRASSTIPYLNIFRGSLILVDTRLNGNLDFHDTFFLKKFKAKGAIFAEYGDFSGANFNQGVDFSLASFEKDIDFSRSQFWQDSQFEEAQFRGFADFAEVHFHNFVDFSQSQFSKLANWRHSSFDQEANFSKTTWRDRAIFSKSRFLESLLFNNATFEKSVAFRQTRFNNIVDLESVSILEQIDFSNAVFTTDAEINVTGLAFESDAAKVLGEVGVIGKILSVSDLEGNENVLQSLVRNFRSLEQISDANQIEYKTQCLRLQQLETRLISTPLARLLRFKKGQDALQWLGLSVLLLLSDYGTNFSLVFGVGILTMAFFGVLFWLIDAWRKRKPKPILPTLLETIYIFSSFAVLLIISVTTILRTAQQPLLTLACLSLIIIPLPLLLTLRLYQQGRYHEMLEETYFVEDGGAKDLRLLIVRLPVIPRFGFWHDRYLPILRDRAWNWLNYYDFSLNNLLKLGFNDIRLRDQHIPGILTTLVWYQWSLGLLYVALLLWTLSRTIPGLNLLIYLK